MNQREAARRAFMARSLSTLGICEEDQHALRRISMQLNRWHEHECNGSITRDDITGRCYTFAPSGRKCQTPDRETGALKRLDKIQARYPDLIFYVQGDPRGAALYVLRKSAVDMQPKGFIHSMYPSGAAVY